MDKKEQKQNQEKRENEKFNSVTKKTKVENQNQTNNVKREGKSPSSQLR